MQMFFVFVFFMQQHDEDGIMFFLFFDFVLLLKESLLKIISAPRESIHCTVAPLHEIIHCMK